MHFQSTRGLCIYDREMPALNIFGVCLVVQRCPTAICLMTVLSDALLLPVIEAKWQENSAGGVAESETQD